MTDILHEWATIGVDCEAWRKMEAFGIPWETLNRCGDPLPVRVRTDGSYFEPSDPDGTVMLVQPVFAGPIPSIFVPVDEPCLVDLIAYSPREPGRWFWRRGEHGLVLGDENLERAELFSEPVRVHRNPLEWLRSGGEGVCVLDGSAHTMDRLRHVGAIIASDVEHGVELEKRLRRLTRCPPINIPVKADAA